MSLFNISKKSSNLPEVSKTDNNSVIQFHPSFKLHDDLNGLVWIGDGPYKNYSSDAAKKNTFELDGIRLVISFMHQDEPSLIFTKQKIEIPENEQSIERPPYFPSYSDLTPEQRWIYLKLLSNPYDNTIDIGFVFILYYGLERHLLSADYINAFKVILKLRDVHTNKSFQSYSANALVLTSMLHKKGELALEFINSLDKAHELVFSDNLFLICYYSFNLPLVAKDIMRMAKTFEFTNNNYIKKNPELFEESLKDIMIERFGKDNIMINDYITKSELNKIKTQDVPIFANMSIIEKTYPVPMLNENFKLKKEMNILLETAHEVTKKKVSVIRKNKSVVPVKED
jgi:hypothetical protein